MAITGHLDLRNIAVGRLMLDNFPNIKAYWIMLTPESAQTALSFGANDIDGTVTEEKITHDAGTTAPERKNRDELARLIAREFVQAHGGAISVVEGEGGHFRVVLPRHAELPE